MNRYLTSSRGSLLRILATALGIVAGNAGLASAQSLFQTATSADLSAAAVTQSSPAGAPAKRSRFVRIDTRIMAQHLAPTEADGAANRAARAQQLDGIVHLNLFPDVLAIFRRTHVEAQPGGGYVWEGEVAGKEFYDALLTIENGQISGRVQLKNRLFRIDPVAGQVHRITELNAAAFPPEAAPLVPPDRGNQTKASPDEAPSPAQATPRATANTVVRVLVAYTVGAQSEAGSRTALIGEIRQAVALANQAYKRGGIPLTLVLAGTKPVAYTESSNISTDLQNLTTGSAFAAVRAKRDTVQADLVSVFRKFDPSFCGIAWLPGSGAMPMPSASTKDLAFSVVVHSCVTNLSFHHELGHNMGLQHDRYVSSAANANVYNFGYVNLPKLVRTVMAYNNACSAQGKYCDRINWFSSPTVKASPGRLLIGIAQGTRGAADNTRRLNLTRTAISQYR